MNVGDVIKCVVIAVGANDNSFVEPIEGEKVNIPIIIERIPLKIMYKGKFLFEDSSLSDYAEDDLYGGRFYVDTLR